MDARSVGIRGGRLKKKRTKNSVWFQYAEEKGLDPHKSAWSDFKEKNPSGDGETTQPPSVRYCTQCGKQIESQSRFCERCGTKIRR
jgi:hypothetical protein